MLHINLHKERFIDDILGSSIYWDTVYVCNVCLFSGHCR